MRLPGFVHMVESCVAVAAAYFGIHMLRALQRAQCERAQASTIEAWLLFGVASIRVFVWE
jgi:hypothetical protein